MTEQRILRTVQVPATTTIGINALSPLVTNSYENVVRGGGMQDSYVVYEFYGENNAIPYFKPYRGTAGNITNISVTKVELVFWHNWADLDNPIKSLDFVAMDQITLDPADNTRPSAMSHGTLWNHISNQVNGLYTTQEIHGLGKTMQTVTLGTTGSDAATDAEAMVSTVDKWFAVGISRTASTTSEEGKIFLGGNNLLHGEGTSWEAADNDEIIAYPSLIVTYENPEGSTWSKMFMHYTTSDPTSNQSTPSNSLGAHRSPNEVYVSSQINDNISTTSTSIPLLSGATLPETSGMVQIGPEIMRYGSIDNSNKLLLNVSRGIVPPSFPMPSGIDPFKEYAHFLEIDRLFDRRPTSGLVQYRCVAFLYDDTAIRIDAPKVILIQDPDANVQIDVGIEVPEYDSHAGVVVTPMTTFTATEAASAEIFAYHRSKGAIPNGSDLFEGGYVVFNPGGTETIAQITSFDLTGITPTRTATFILDRDVSATVNPGDSFRINPGPCQTVGNETVTPTENSGRFFGFFGDGGSNLIGYNNIKERNGWMLNYDVFYLWVKRTLTNNKKTTLDTGAVVLIEFDDTVRQSS